MNKTMFVLAAALCATGALAQESGREQEGAAVLSDANSSMLVKMTSSMSAATSKVGDPVTGELIDPYDGMSDIARGIVRAVGDPDERFLEDPLRLLRAARFVAQLGFLVADDTRAAMTRQAPELARISVERIYAELTKLLLGDFAGHGLDLLLDTGLFEIAMPELQPLAHDGAQLVDRLQAALLLVVPERPAVAGVEPLHDGAEPMDRAGVALEGKRPIGADRGGEAAA